MAPSPLGAVLVFEDLTAQRQLAQERRGAEQLQLLTRVVARIADEIKNPLVSINAFMELIGERYDDATFRNQFSSVVGRDVRRLVQIFDKLAALVNEGDYKRDDVDLRAGGRGVPRRAGRRRPCPTGDEAARSSPSPTSPPRSTSPPPSPTRARPSSSRVITRMLKKAIAYLVWYLLRKTPGPEAKIAVSISHLAQRTTACASRSPPAPPRSEPEELHGDLRSRSRSSRRTSSTSGRA